MEVIEQYVFGVLGNVIRDDSRMTPLMKPYQSNASPTGDGLPP
jgi:hypothetical protein